jgi:hypothetical protein
MGDRIAMERLARQKLINARAEHANGFISKFALKSLGEIDRQLAEPYCYLSGFVADAAWLAKGVETDEEFSVENQIQCALTRGFFLGMLFQRAQR